MTARHAWVMAFAIALSGVMGAAPGAISPATAECEPAGPDPRIEDHRGFAFEGVVEQVEGRREAGDGWVYRITIAVTEALAGEPGPTVAFDTGRGGCWLVQGDRFKVGDRLIVTASGPPVAGPVAHLSSAWIWRYEWEDRWTFHAYRRAFQRSLDPSITRPTTRDGVLALVAPDRLRDRLDPDAWRATLVGSRLRIQDVVAWRDGFVALASVPAADGRRLASILGSESGETWTEVADPFPEAVPAGEVDRLVEFQGALYLFGLRDGRLIAWRSVDARGWHRVDGGEAFATTPTTFLGERAPDAIGSVGVSDAGILVLVGRSAWTSRDGVDWVTGVMERPVAIRGDPVGSLTGFLLAQCFCSGPDQRWVLLESTDSITWSQIGDLPSGHRELATDEARRRLLAATLVTEDDGDRHAAVDASDDGVTWTRLVTAPGTIANQVSIAAADDAIAVLISDHGAGHSSSWTMISEDAGATWTRSPIPDTRPAECVDRIAIGTTRIVAVGVCGPVRAWVADRVPPVTP